MYVNGLYIARANECVHEHNERNFPQAKPFLLNEHRDLYFLSRNNTVHIIFFNLKKN